jgi:Protein of unknown function (DUF3108)
VLALVFVGGAYFSLHGRHSPPSAPTSSEAASSEAPAVRSAPVTRAERAAARPASDTDRKAPAASSAGIVLRTGETLEYTASVSGVSRVANLRLGVAEQRTFAGKSAWHLQAFARTENPLRMVFELDDQFDSYSDTGTLASLQYEMHLRERGQKVESIQRMLTSGKDPAPADAVGARVLPGTRDPLGLIQYLRRVEWVKTPEVRSTVYDGRKLYDVRATLAGRSLAVSVPVGSYRASKIEIRVFENNVELKDSHFSLYLSDAPEHLPVLLEAVLPFATARVELRSIR